MEKVKISNPEKVFWPNEGYTKADLISYYQKISPYILPYLKDRPQSMHRFPDGIYGEQFYQKNYGFKTPDFVKRAQVSSETGGEINFLVANNVESVIYMANLGCIEFNPWSSRLGKLESPDWAVIDLDPEEISFDEVIIVAREVQETLNSLKVSSYCKTSGATGLHIYIPLRAKYSYEQAKHFAHIIVANVHRKLPRTTSLERLPKKRQGKVYLDYLQNNIGQTLASPYSLRPKEGAPVSTPLAWDEVKKGLSPSDFNIKTIFNRLEKIGDIFHPVLSESIDLKKVILRISRE